MKCLQNLNSDNLAEKPKTTMTQFIARQCILNVDRPIEVNQKFFSTISNNSSPEKK